MAELKLVNNPFNPGTATRPAYLAGRHKEREVIEETLVRIANIHKLKQEGLPYRGPLTPIKIVGPRGVGKTTLLAEARKKAQEMKIHVLFITQLPHLAHRELLADLMGERGYDLLRARSFRDQGALAGVVKSTSAISLPQLFRKKMEKKPVLLLMDEVMHYNPQALEYILHMCQNLIGDKYPFAMIMAGTPQLDLLLRNLKTGFIKRSNQIYINALSDDETLEALSKPFERDEVKVENKALLHMAKLTDNYPYFTQIVGAHVWDAMLASGKRKVSKALVRETEHEIQLLREEFYSSIYAKMISADLVKHANRAMEILRQHQGKAKRQAIISGLGNTAKNNFEKKYVDIFHELKDLGFLWEHIGWVEAANPSLFEYFQERPKKTRATAMIKVSESKPVKKSLMYICPACMSEPSVLLRRPYQVAGVPIWVEVVGDRSSISGISIDTAGGKLARRGAQAATTPLGRRADRQFRAYCANPRRAIKLPLAQHEQIPSQRAAMAFLARIPLGETRSYQEQAQAVKQKCRNGFNARNAGNANRGNHYPLAIPCHRVIRSDGDVGGFMGSTGAAARELKQALLRHEGALT